MRRDADEAGPGEAVVDLAVDAFGGVTILVNNAGGGGPQPFDMPLDKFEWAFELNVFAGFHFSQLCAPHMEAAGSRRHRQRQLHGRREQGPAT